MSQFLQGHEALPALLVSDRPSSRRRRIDRGRVASLLADGCPVAEVAAKVGCSRQHVWRLMRKSEFLGRALAAAEYEVGKEADGRLAALRPAVADALKREIDEGNVRVLLWLAERLGVGAAGYTPPSRAVGAEPAPLPPGLHSELTTLRRDLEWYRSELDRRDRMEDLERGDDGDPDADVA